VQPTFSACGDLSGNWENEPSKRPDAQSIAETCSNARDAVHRFFTIAIPAWLTARHAAALKWIADGRAQTEMNGAFKTAHSSVLVFPFASAVVGAKGPSELFIMLNQAERHNSSPRLRTHGTNTSHTLVHGLFKWTSLSTTQPFRPTCPLRTLCTPGPHLPLARCNSTHWVSHWRRPLGQHGLVLTPRA